MKYSACDKNKLTLNSPTLLTGDNGVGKSVLSKILSGIIRTNKGEVSIQAPNGQCGARLLFQDSIAQLFGMSIDDHLDWVFKFEGDKRKVALSIYNEIDSVMREYLTVRGLDYLPALGEIATCNTLLQAKMSLIAERLASLPPLLILDEPGWGLSRSIARKFVWTVCQHASKYNVAILLISHQSDWWKGIIKSHLHLTKEHNANIRIEEKDIKNHV
jgi:energy-coupling factor transport system ATP-binding protein